MMTELVQLAFGAAVGAVFSVLLWWVIAGYSYDAALWLVRSWVRTYTSIAPSRRRERRRREMESDLQMQIESERERYAPEVVALHLLVRAADGFGDDLGWTASAVWNGWMDRRRFKQVRSDWPRLMEWVASRSLLVHSYLQISTPAAVEGEWLVLRFAFKLHHDRICAPRNREFVEQGLVAQFGRPMKLRCELASHVHVEATGGINLDDPVLRFALERFGGRARRVETPPRRRWSRLPGWGIGILVIMAALLLAVSRLAG